MRILMSMFGWNDSGGGTILPRLTALELHKRGHEVMVIYAAVPQIDNAPAYQIREHSDQGVQLVGIHNRPALFLDHQHPERELNDPQIVQIFKHYFDIFEPELVHYHNFLGLSLGIVDLAYAAATPSFYTPYNFWLLCPTLYLNLPNLALCQGVNSSGSNCLQCTRAPRPGSDYVQRRDRLRQEFQARVGPCLASSDCVKELLLQNGYSPEQVEILKFANERSAKIWQEAGAERQPAVPEIVKIGFTGSVIPIKGVHTLVAAAQLLSGPFEILIYGQAPADYLDMLQKLDPLKRVQFKGFFEDHDHAKILAELSLAVVPSVCYDHSPLVIGEFLAARTPVIGANIGGIPDYIPPGCGQLFEAGNAEDLARVLQAYIDNPTLIPALQARIQEPLSFEDYISTLEQRYDQARQKGQSHLQKIRIERWQQKRGHSAFYHLNSLKALSESEIKNQNTPFGLDLWPGVELPAPEHVNDAQWLSTPVPVEITRTLHPLGTQAEKLIYAPLAQIKSHPEHFDFTPQQTQRIVLPWPAGSQQAEQILLWFLAAAPKAEQILIIVPWQQSFASVEERLFAILDTLPETTHNLTLFDLNESLQTFQELIQAVSHLILDAALAKDFTLQAYAQLCQTIVLEQSAIQYPDAWEIDAVPDFLQEQASVSFKAYAPLANIAPLI